MAKSNNQDRSELAAELAKYAGLPADVNEAQAIIHQRRKNVHSMTTAAGGKRYESYRFETWVRRTNMAKSVALKVEQWADTFPERLKGANGLVLWGPCGTGKDHLMHAAVRKAMLVFGVSCVWVNCRDLFGDIRDRIADNAQTERSLISSLCKPDILVLSDPTPPVGVLSGHQADMLYRVVENRYADHRLTCATVNVRNDEDAEERIGAPTWDRMLHGAWKIQMHGVTHRGPDVST